MVSLSAQRHVLADDGSFAGAARAGRRVDTAAPCVLAVGAVDLAVVLLVRLAGQRRAARAATKVLRMPLDAVHFNALVGDRLLTRGALDGKQLAVALVAKRRALVLQKLAVRKLLLARRAHKALWMIALAERVGDGADHHLFARRARRSVERQLASVGRVRGQLGRTARPATPTTAHGARSGRHARAHGD